MLTTRRLFHTCRLVHADLSEYNILYHENALHIIDVSQSVEHDHPHAFDFLRKDLDNIEEFFSRRGVYTLGLRRSFDYVTREKESLLADSGIALKSENDDLDALNEAEVKVLDLWLSKRADTNKDSDLDEEDGEEKRAHEDAVFKQSYIPRNLNEVIDPERDVDVLTRGEGGQLIYADSIGLVHPQQQSVFPATDTQRRQEKAEENKDVDNTGERLKQVSFDDEKTAVASSERSLSNTDFDQSNDEDSGSEDEDDNEEGEGEAEGLADRKPRGHRHEDREEKKARKKAVKEEAREKRKTKIKKVDKKKQIKATRRG